MAKAKGKGIANDPKLEAVQTVYGALNELSSEERLQVLSSVRALLNMPNSPTSQIEDSEPRPSETRDGTPSARKRLSLVELISDKQPKTNPERIAAFAYYREHIEGIPQFERDDLRPYFIKARLAAPTNYDRDFVGAVKQGWIHEEGSGSYLTNRGSQAVEAGFVADASRASRGRNRRKTARKAKSNRSRKPKARGRR